MAQEDLRGFEWYYLTKLCDQTPIRLLGHDKAVMCVAFHSDGNRIVSGGVDGTVRIWDLAGRRAIRIFDGARGAVHCVAVSPDGRWLAAGDAKGGLRLWEFATGKVRGLRGHQSRLSSVAFSPDSRHLLSAEAAGLIVQWDAGTGEYEFDLSQTQQAGRKPSNSVSAKGGVLFRGTIATYAPDGQTIVSVGLGQRVMIWDVATRRLAHPGPGRKNPWGISIHPNGRDLALAEQFPGVEIVDIKQPHRPRRAVARREQPRCRRGV